VNIDDQPGIAAAVEHLVALGHRDIAHVSGPTELVHSVSRRTAWARAISDAGLQPAPCITADFSAEGGANATNALLDLDEPPTAIVYANDLMAIAGMSTAVSRGVEVPGQLSVTGFDDTPLSAYIQPALTTVRTDVVGWGAAAARTAVGGHRPRSRLRDQPADTRVCHSSFNRAATPARHRCTPKGPSRIRADPPPKRDPMKKKVCAAAVITLAMGTTAACGGSGGTTATGGSALTAHGPVKVWLSNNPDEITWGKTMVKAWNTAHPKELVTAQEIPAGKTSEEVIGAAITAGNAPCLVYNTSPAAVPGFQKQGGLVALDSFKDGKATSKRAPARPQTSTSRRTGSSTRSHGSPTPT